ncbi:hybrid sensor histidine kinase/response regulator [Photobacterium kishitanii]|uniref:hybrid sensor histidine kinase/response regulator n=1 Tax=Photobacterium kishitanii TaxID=318456 RepID=UPI000D1605DF|nr:hybrid sensor histidine kinase/response regulator [Photobacterium kishitanii]PSV16075.1 hybrid sensor histidine kinase/response regulator [Photobacterium kishitanii]
MADLYQAVTTNIIAIFLIAISAVIAVWTGYFARFLYSKPSLSHDKRIYFPYIIYTSFISLWILSNAYFQSSLLIERSNIVAVNIALAANIFSGLAFIFAYLFSCRIISTKENFSLTYTQKFLLYTSIIITLLTNIIPKINITSIDIKAIGVFSINFGALSFIFFGMLIIILLLTIINLLILHKNNTCINRVKAKYMITGIIAFISSTFLIHFIAAVIFHNFSAAWLPPALSVIEVFLIGYALFNSRFYSLKYIIFITSSSFINIIFYIVPVILLELYHIKETPFFLVLWTLITGFFWNRTLRLVRLISNKIIYHKKGNPVENITKIISEFKISTDLGISRLNAVICSNNGLILQVSNKNQLLRDYFKTGRNILLKQDLDVLLNDNISADNHLHLVSEQLHKMDVTLVVPILDENKKITHFYITSKEMSNELFSCEEIMGLQRLFERANRFINTEEKVRKSQVLAGSIAHEIRNPLSKIKYHFEKIDSDFLSAHKKSINSLATIEIEKIHQELSEGKKALQLGTQFIDVILDELRGSSISTSFFQHYSAASLTSQALNDFSLYSEEHKKRIHLETTNDFYFYGSDTLFSFVLFNLLKNAAYYFDSFPESHITIQFENNKIHVRDTGPGITEEQLENLFDEFYSFGKISGNGLGLAYCQKVMESFSGSISCHSILGEFTEFTLTFPAINIQSNGELTNPRIKQHLSGQSCLILSTPRLSKKLTENFNGLNMDIECSNDPYLSFTRLKDHPFNFIVIDHRLYITHYDQINMLREGKYGHLAQITPIFIFNSTSINLNNDRVSVSKHAQGYIDTLNGALAFECSLEAIINDAKFAPLGNLNDKTVLVVDDMHANRLLVKAYLSKEGVNVIQAASGYEAIEQVKKNNIDLIFMDIHMPGMNGIDTAKQIKKIDNTTPIIALSGEYGEQIASDIHEIMDDYIVKPIDKSSLVSLTSKWLIINKVMD